MSAPVIAFENVMLAVGGQTLFGPVSAVVQSPGITVIMGPNGAGKSLFLGAAHGLLPQMRGGVHWDGVAASQSRAKRGFVFQTTPVMRRSVAGNIAFPLFAQNLPRAERARLLDRALRAARLHGDAGKPAAALSGGERKRLALARATVTEPRAVLLDEPAANLDPASTLELEQSLRRISDEGTKVLLSTHDVAQARRLADDVLFFDHGQLVEQADADTFFEHPATPAAERYLRGEL